MTEKITLLTALKELLQFFEIPGESTSARLDRLEKQYRAETGGLTLGKQYDSWVQSKIDAARKAVSEAEEQV